MKLFGLKYETENLTPIIMEEFGFAESIARVIAQRLYELGRDIHKLKVDVQKDRATSEDVARLTELVKESNALSKDLGTTIIHVSSKDPCGFILVLPSGKSNDKDGLGWEINRWKQYFVDIKNTVDMDGLSW